MPGLDPLRSEHTLILQTIDRLEARSHESPDGRLPLDYARAALAFMRVYIDENHHGKEERVLFAQMEADPFLSGIAAVLMADHRDGRELVDAIERAVESGRPVVREIDAYAAYIRDHIRRENDMVFQAAESRFDESTMSTIRAAFFDIEAEVLGTDGKRQLLAGLQTSAD